MEEYWNFDSSNVLVFDSWILLAILLRSRRTGSLALVGRQQNSYSDEFCEAERQKKRKSAYESKTCVRNDAATLNLEASGRRVGVKVGRAGDGRARGAKNRKIGPKLSRSLELVEYQPHSHSTLHHVVARVFTDISNVYNIHNVRWKEKDGFTSSASSRRRHHRHRPLFGPLNSISWRWTEWWPSQKERESAWWFCAQHKQWPR